MDASVGDEIVVDSMELGGPVRKGEIREVHGGNGEPRFFLVRWDDGHETTFFPGATSHVVHLSSHRATRRRTN